LVPAADLAEIDAAHLAADNKKPPEYPGVPGAVGEI
jgi:hypothetical protein